MFAGIKPEKLENIEIINLEGRQYDSLNLSPLKNSSKLKILNLSNNKLTKLDFRVLKNCTMLEEIKLTGNKIEEIELISFPNLKILNLHDNKLTSIGLKFLEKCTNLDFLNLGRNNLTEIDLSPLSNCINLDALFLLNNQLMKIDLPPLEKCTNLKTLFLEENNLEEIDLTVLKHIDNFESLLISNNRITSIDLSPFAINQSDNTSEFEQKKQLRSISLSNNRLKAIDLSPLMNHQGFYHLNLDNNLLEEINLSPLSSCTDLRSLSLENNRLTKLDLSPLKELAELRELSLTNNPIQNLDLSDLIKCTEVRLYLSGIDSYMFSKEEEPPLRHPLYDYYQRIERKKKEEIQKNEREKRRYEAIESHSNATIDVLNDNLHQILEQAYKFVTPDSYIVESIIDNLAKKANNESAKYLETLVKDINHDYIQEFTGVLFEDSPYGYFMRDPEQNWFVCFQKALEALISLDREKAIMGLLSIYREWLLLDSNEISSVWSYPRSFEYKGYYSPPDAIYMINSIAKKISDEKFIQGIKNIVEESLEYIFEPEDDEEYALKLRKYYIKLLKNDEFLKSNPKYLLVFLLQLLEKNRGIEIINSIREKFSHIIKSNN